jgi:multidrug efflux system membrane fusion protein
MPDPRGSTGTTRKRRWTAAIVALVAGGAALYWYQSPGSEAPRPARAGARPAVRVSVAIAARQDVPVYATGLGSVQASYTIGIHSQVEGIMQEVLFTEGQRVKKGDVLARIDPRLYQAALDQAKAKRMQDAALLISAEKDLQRSKTLVGQNVATQQLVDQQQARVDQLKGSAADEAAIETAQTQLDYTQIKSPSDGRIGVRSVDPGNLVHASDARAIATVVHTQPSAVMFTLPMQVLDDLREALARGPVEVTAFDQHNRRQLSTGTLLLIDNIIDQSTATLRLKAMFANKDERLWPGEFVNARALLDVRKNVIALPSTVVQRGQKGLFAWVVTDDNKAVQRPIALGPVSGDLTVFAAGIAEGDRDVTDGQYKLQVDAPVEIVGGPKTAENNTAESNTGASNTAESAR